MTISVAVDSVTKNTSIGENEITFTISNKSLIILREAINFYIKENKGDTDDPKKVKLRDEIKDVLHQAWTTMNPS